MWGATVGRPLEPQEETQLTNPEAPGVRSRKVFTPVTYSKKKQFSHECRSPFSRGMGSGMLFNGNPSKEGKTMAASETEIWKSARLTIERGETESNGTIFRLTGPFTGRDMYNSLSPDAFRNIFESPKDSVQSSTHVFDLTEVPYMDSTGLGMLVSHYVRCQSKGVHLGIRGANDRVQELFRLTGMTGVLPLV
jgi:anti-anti-sigma factor